MTKTIDTLVDDVYALMENREPVSEELIDQFCADMGAMIKRRLNGPPREPHLSMSNIGTRCGRKLWYSINEADDGEPLKGQVLLNFLYGDVIELLYLMLFRAAGHKVEYEQIDLDLEGIPGHPDCVIDGRLVDVKSVNGRSKQKFENHKLLEDDPFGYLEQGTAYLASMQDRLAPEHRNLFTFVAIDKERGGLVLDTYNLQVEVSDNWLKEIKGYAREAKELVTNDEVPVDRLPPVADGKSGNEKLCVTCSYCQFREKCWPDVRTFLYSNGPRFLTKVEKVPNVYEVPKDNTKETF